MGRAGAKNAETWKKLDKKGGGWKKRSGREEREIVRKTEREKKGGRGGVSLGSSI